MPRPTPDPAATSALNAFLRGVERRAVVFAELLCGDPARAEDALSAAMRAFRPISAQSAMTDWPRRFWGLLLATPSLRKETAAPTRVGALHWLGQVGQGPRAALLLRLVGGLGEADAAAVLGVTRPTYRLALHHALPRDAQGEPDPAAWSTLGEAVQDAVKALPATRLAQLARLREAALLGHDIAAGPPRRDAPAPEAPPTRWRSAAMAGVAAIALAALAFTFFFRPTPAPGGLDDPRIRVDALPSAERPAATFDAATALATERDFTQLASGSDEAFLRDLDFYAWYAAQRAGAIDEARLRIPADDARAPDDNPDTLETTDASL